MTLCGTEIKVGVPSSMAIADGKRGSCALALPIQDENSYGTLEQGHPQLQACGRDVPTSAAADGSKPNSLRGGLAAAAAAMLMAGYVVVGKLYVSEEPAAGTTPAATAAAEARNDPGVFLLCRQLVATVVMLGWAVHQHGFVLPKREHRNTLHTLGLLNFINAIGFVWGIKLTTAFVTSVTQLSIPVMAILLAAATGQETPTFASASGLLITVAGCACVAVGGQGQGEHPAPQAQVLHTGEDDGDVFGAAWVAWANGFLQNWSFEAGICILLLQCFSFVTLVVVQKKVLRHYPVALVVGWSYALCTMWVLLSVVLSGTAHLVPEQFNSSHKLAIIAYSALGGAVCYFYLIGYASKHLPCTFVAASVALEPLAVSAMGLLFFGQTLSTTEVGGYVLAAFGTIVFAFAPRHTTADARV